MRVTGLWTAAAAVSSMFAAAFGFGGRTVVRPAVGLRSSLPFLVRSDARSMTVLGSASTDAETSQTSSSSSGAQWTTDRVRSQFISYFTSHPSLPHAFHPSSPCAPLNDPTLLFTNAGMNQFKPIFLGQADPSSPLASLRRAANSQKCIRAGGKHNDLDDVGKDTYHHTFFEMLGSWSFGDYFKKEAVDMAWDLLTRVYGLEEDRIYATYFRGDDRVAEDVEARDLWLRHLPPSRVIGCSARDNFWEMGDQGPCGPCSEVHYDRVGGGRDASAIVNADDPDVIEIWNIVFVQYNRDERGVLGTLPAAHIDTGMGLERLVSVLQQRDSNYDTDAFAPIFDEIARHTPHRYRGRVGADDKGAVDTAYRAVADHVRTLCFSIADGAVPDNEGRGYVLRRILRRGARYARQVLGVRDVGLLSRLVPVVVERYGDAYPELRERRDTIVEIITDEEKSFDTMLDRGIKYFNDLTENEDKPVTTIAGDQAFFLYDTMGFPVDLTEIMAEEKGLTVDTEGFHREMEAQKQRSREARFKNKASEGGRLEFIAEQTAWLADQHIPPTDDALKFQWDVTPKATIQALYTPDRGFVEPDQTLVVRPGDTVGVLLDRTSFYAEAGGQETDRGFLLITNEDDGTTSRLRVQHAQAYAGYVLHTCTAVDDDGVVSVRAQHTTLTCAVDYRRRRDIAPNHTMTHVLNAALREVLGDGVDQRGSLCNHEKLRFDFSHPRAMEPPQIRRTEELVRSCIAAGLEIRDRLMPLNEAQKLDGVRAVFGEMYPDPVRVVSIGDNDHSVEFCGGTHLQNTRDAEAFVLVEETAVAKGIRRISGLTKGLAKKAMEEGDRLESLVVEAEASSSENTADLRKSIEAATISAPLKVDLRGRMEALQKKLFEAKKAQLAQRVDVVLNEVKELVAQHLESSTSNNNDSDNHHRHHKPLVLNLPDLGADSKASVKVVKLVSDAAPDLPFMGLSEEEAGSGGKLACFALVPPSVLETTTLRADDWVRETLAVAGGRGGGKPGNAQGQAKRCDDVDAVLRKGSEYAESMMSE